MWSDCLREITRRSRAVPFGGMTGAQRILVLFCLPLFAWLLHSNLCEWSFTGKGDYTGLITWARPAQNSTWNVYGLFVEPMANWLAAFVMGVVLPLALIAVEAFLLLGLRHQHRSEHSLCVHCGYDLRGTPGIEKCPECGKGRA
jgi:hypothetical protein